jgi:hypothetical protein
MSRHGIAAETVIFTPAKALGHTQISIRNSVSCALPLSAPRRGEIRALRSVHALARKRGFILFSSRLKPQIASAPRSPVRIRIASSIEDTNILPSPIRPV